MKRPQHLLDEVVRKALTAYGVDPSTLKCADGTPARVAVVAASMKDAAEALDAVTRDQVLMVRVDVPTLKTLDSWVLTGVAKSRSEAAALFLKEGLAVRAEDLRGMSRALEEFQAAKQKLEHQASRLLDRAPMERVAKTTSTPRSTSTRRKLSTKSG